MGNRYKEFLRHIFLEDDTEDMYLFDDHVKGAWRNAFQVKINTLFQNKLRFLPINRVRKYGQLARHCFTLA